MSTHYSAARPPRDRYDRPVDVLADPELTRREKVAVLRGWRLDAIQLATATAENLTGADSPNQLGEVLSALRQLRADPV